MTDRFCPACGKPHVNNKLHPRFGPVPNEPPGPPPRPSQPPEQDPFCPRCWSVIRLSDPFCSACGMALDEARLEAAINGYLGDWLLSGPRGEGRFRPIERRGRIAQALLVLVAALSLAIAGISLATVFRYDGLFRSLQLTDDEVMSWEGLLRLATAGASLLAALAFVAWASRAYRNLLPLGVRPLKLSPRWATAVWFVPFVNLVLPKEVIDDLYRGSDPNVPPLSPEWRLRTVPARIHMWWVLVLSAAVLLASAQWALPAPGVDNVAAARTGSILAGLAHLCAAGAALIAVWVVARVDSRQQHRLERLGVSRRRRPAAAEHGSRPSTKVSDGEPEPEPYVPGAISVSREEVPEQLLTGARTGTVYGRY